GHAADVHLPARYALGPDELVPQLDARVQVHAADLRAVDERSLEQPLRLALALRRRRILAHARARVVPELRGEQRRPEAVPPGHNPARRATAPMHVVRELVQLPRTPALPLVDQETRQLGALRTVERQAGAQRG